MDTKIKQNQDKMLHETEKVSSYAEIIKTSATEDLNSSKELHPKALANNVISKMKTTDRKRNLVFYGVPARITGTQSTRRVDYTEALEDLVVILGSLDTPKSVELLKPNINSLPKEINEEENEDIITCTLRVQFATEAIAFKVLKNAPRLKAIDEFSGVYVAPDRTPDEQKARNQLVEQLKLKIKEQPAVKWVIRRGEITNSGKWEGRTKVK